MIISLPRSASRRAGTQRGIRYADEWIWASGLALNSAEARARERDFGGAMRWLEVVEDLELYLPREYELKRISWQELDRST